MKSNTGSRHDVHGHIFDKNAIQVGSRLPQISRKWSLESFRQRHELVYGPGKVVEEAWPEKNIHADESAAQREGLPEPIGSAPQLIAMVHKIMMMSFGAGWLEGGYIDVKMIEPFRVGDVTTAKGFVDGISIERRDKFAFNDVLEQLDAFPLRANCITRVERRDGTPLLVGSASALVH